MELYLHKGKQSLWDNLQRLEEDYLISNNEQTLTLINRLKREVEARLRFEKFIDLVATDGLAAMEELSYLNKGE